MKGLDSKGFGNFVLKSVIRDKENLEVYENVTKGTRKVMSLPLLKILGHKIAKVGGGKTVNKGCGGTSTLAFFESLRAGEILVKGERVFCPEYTLLWTVEGCKILWESSHSNPHKKKQSPGRGRGNL